MDRCALLFGLALLVGGSGVATAQLTVEWARIGNPGNAPDPLTGSGSVSYVYEMATTEVTNEQYTAFLNAVASDDPHDLYNSQMGFAIRGGIIREGSPGSYIYATIPGREQHPVIYTSFFDAMRFVNWLHNGQGKGDTETGVYTIVNGGDETRSPGARYFLPTESEWHKAAYFQPASDGGDNDGYWLYPTSSNNTPVPGVDASYNGSSGDSTTPVATFAANYYGVFDMAGNVFEFTEQLGNTSPPVITRELRGGSWFDILQFLQSTQPLAATPDLESFRVGFRIARSTQTICSGDTNGDNLVNFADLNAVLAQFGQTGPGIPGDVTGDEVVNFADLNTVLSAFGNECD